MINSIIEAINTSLSTEFGYEVHTEKIGQESTSPSFLIKCLSAAVEPRVGKRYLRQNQFCIELFQGSEESLHQCNDVAERLFWCLEYVTLDDETIKGSKMKSEIVDGCLNFFVNYDLNVYRYSETSGSMNEVSISQKVD